MDLYFIGQKIKSVREKEKITQENFSKSIEISRSLLSQIESGKSIPTYDTLKKIIDTYNVDAKYFFDPILDIEIVNVSNNNKLSEKEFEAIKNDTLNRVFANIAMYKILERKLDLTLKNNREIKEFLDAAIEMAMFKDSFNDFLQTYILTWLDFPSTKKNDLLTKIELLKKQFETLKPYKKAILNFAKSIEKFNKEMYEAGDENFAFTQKN